MPNTISQHNTPYEYINKTNPSERQKEDDPCIPDHLDLGGTKHMVRRAAI